MDDINDFYALSRRTQEKLDLMCQCASPKLETCTRIEKQVQGTHTTFIKKSSHQALKESTNQFTVVTFGIRREITAFILVSLDNARPEELPSNLLLLLVQKRNALTFTRGCSFGFPLSKFLHEDCISRCTSSRRQAFVTPMK